MSPTRREALAQLSVLLGVPLVRWPEQTAEPLLGTIADFQTGRLRGDWSAESVTGDALAKCRTVGAQLHAIDLLSEAALAEARESDARLKKKALRGPLDGAPVFAKSIYDVRGMATTASNSDWAALFPHAVSRDAIEVERLRTAGAVILGKTAADDFAYRGIGASTLTGQVLNRLGSHDVDRNPGGSSAGSAVAALFSLAFAGLGTDDGGSNRIPAQFSGVVGIKPTFGLVPRSGVIPTWPYLDTHGAMTRTVADAALMLDAVAGPDKEDKLALSASWRAGALRALNADALKGVRVGIVDLHAPRAQMSAESQMVFDRAVEDIKSAGGVVQKFSPAVTRANYRQLFTDYANARGDVKPDPNSPAATANALYRYFQRQGLSAANAADAVKRGLLAYQKYYDVLPKEWDAMSRLITQPYETDPAGVSFAKSRATAIAALADSFRTERVDVMVYPTMPFPSPPVGTAWPSIPTTLGYGNWLGFPEVSVPAGMASDGYPAGNVSFVGLPGSDAKVLAYAHAYEQHSHRFSAPPR